MASDLRDAAAQAITAGVDIDMVSGAYSAHLSELVEADVLHLGRLVAVLVAFGLQITEAQGGATGEGPDVVVGVPDGRRAAQPVVGTVHERPR